MSHEPAARIACVWQPEPERLPLMQSAAVIISISLALWALIVGLPLWWFEVI